MKHLRTLFSQLSDAVKMKLIDLSGIDVSDYKKRPFPPVFDKIGSQEGIHGKKSEWSSRNIIKDSWPASRENPSMMLSDFKVDMAKRTSGIGSLQNRELFDDLRADRVTNDVDRPTRRQFNGEPSRWLWLKTRVFG